MERKLLFFDIDETLVDGKTQTVPESAKEGLFRAHENGHLIFINTGRCKSFLPSCLFPLPIDGFAYGCGSHIEYRGELLFLKYVPSEDLVWIRKAMLETALQGVFQGPQYCYFDDTTDYYDNFKNFLKMYERDYHAPKKSFYEKNMAVNKLVTFREEHCDYERFVKKMKKEYQLIENGGGFTEILPLPYTKATCMDFLMDYFHIGKENCFVFGDSPNDLPMLTHIENSIAMGNSYEVVKEAAKYVTAEIDQDGIYQALKHFSII